MGRRTQKRQGVNWAIVAMWVGAIGIVLVAVGMFIYSRVGNETPAVSSVPSIGANQHKDGHIPLKPKKAEEKVSSLRSRADSKEEVLSNTPFVANYKAALPEISKGHTDEDLASHGVDVCKRIADPRETVTGMVYAFMKDYHNHDGPVDAQAAKKLFAVSLQDICPQLVPQWEEKPAL